MFLLPTVARPARLGVAVLVVACAVPGLAAAQTVTPAPASTPATVNIVPPSAPAPDKSGYTLFNPVPIDQMRAFSTDRPDKSNSPYTVDAGHFQYESDLFNYTFTRSDGVSTRSIATADPVLKMGLTNNIDLELGLTGYANTRVDNRPAGTRFRADGFGDLYPRLKINVLGNDSGAFALAVIPYVKIPTASLGLGNNQVEGGVIAPLSISLPMDFTLILMTELDVLKNANDSSKHVNFTNLANLSHTIYGNLSGAVEFASSVGTDTGTPAIYTFDPSVSYALTPNLQLDAASYIGLNKAAPGLTLYFGISQRF